jgi:hypothetical protein
MIETCGSPKLFSRLRRESGAGGDNFSLLKNLFPGSDKAHSRLRDSSKETPSTSPVSSLKEKPSPLELPKESKEKESKEKESKDFLRSPFHPFGGRKWKAPSRSPKPAPIKDHRIPDYLPLYSILYVEKGGVIATLPRGLPGEVLQCNEDGKPEWRMPYPPIKLSEESATLLQKQKE